MQNYSSDDVLDLSVSDSDNFRALLRMAHDKVCPNRHGKKRKNRAWRYSTKKLRLLAKQNFRCLDCDRKIYAHNGPRHLDATFEHIIPYRYGSSMSDHNLVMLCDSCNRARDKNFKNNGRKMVEDHYGPIDWDALLSIPIVEIV